MAPCRCVVSFEDPDGIVHEVQVYASTVYEAVGVALQELDQGSLSDATPGPMTEFRVVVHRQPVTHKLKLQQVTSWAQGAGRSPQELIHRKHLRRFLKLKDAE